MGGIRKSNKKIIIFLIIILILIVVGLVVFLKIKQNNEKYNFELTSISKEDVKYYVLKEDAKFGVIDSDGKIVLKPVYDDVEIPNPTRGIFLCCENLNTDDVNYKAYDENGNQILTQYEDVEAIPINQLTSEVPYEKTILKYKNGNNYGLIDFDGKIIKDAQYEEIENLDYKEGFLKVMQKGLYGIINIKGEDIIKIEYDDISSDGYYNDETKYSKSGFITRIKTDDGYKFGYINSNGKELLECNYNDISRITEINDQNNVYLLTTLNGKVGLVKNKENIFNNDYVAIQYDKTSNLVILNTETSKGVANLEGKIIIPIDYDYISIGGDYITTQKSETQTVYDLSGNKIDTSWESHERVSDNYSIVIDNDGYYNILDNSNQRMLKNKYIYIEYYMNDLFIATEESTTGVINANEQIVVPIQYGTLQKIDGTNLLAGTLTKSGRVDIINQNGDITEGIANGTLEKNDNYILVYSENNRKYYNFEGKEISYKDINSNNELYASKQGDKWGFVDKNGNLKINYQFDFVTEFNKDVAGIKVDGLWGVINKNGEVILQPTYNLTWNNVKFISTYYEINNGIGIPIYSSK